MSVQMHIVKIQTTCAAVPGLTNGMMIMELITIRNSDLRNNTGEDYLYTQDRHGYIQESVYNFTWDWFNSMYTSIRLTYGPGDYSYMDNISMGGNRLNCLLDGQPVYFVGK